MLKTKLAANARGPNSAPSTAIVLNMTHSPINRSTKPLTSALTATDVGSLAAAELSVMGCCGLLS